MRKKSDYLSKMWGEEIAKMGFIRVPQGLLQNKKELGVNVLEIVMVCYLKQLMAKRKSLSISQAKLAAMLGVHKRTVQKRIERLKKRRYIRVKTGAGNEPNQFSLKGFRKRLAKIEKEIKDQRDMWS